jgi:hypothetical protein
VDAFRIDLRMRGLEVLEKEIKILREPDATFVGLGARATALGSHHEAGALVEPVDSLDEDPRPAGVLGSVIADATSAMKIDDEWDRLARFHVCRREDKVLGIEKSDAPLLVFTQGLNHRIQRLCAGEITTSVGEE